MAQNNRTGRGGALPSLAVSPPRAGEQPGANNGGGGSGGGGGMSVTSHTRGGNPTTGRSQTTATAAPPGMTVNGRPAAGTAGSRSPKKVGSNSRRPHQANVDGTLPSIVPAGLGNIDGDHRIPVLPRQKTLPLFAGNPVASQHYHDPRRSVIPSGSHAANGGHSSSGSGGSGGSGGAAHRSLLPTITSRYTVTNQEPVATNGSVSVNPGIDTSDRSPNQHHPAPSAKSTTVARNRHRNNQRQTSSDSTGLHHGQQQQQKLQAQQSQGEIELISDKQQQLMGRFDVAGWSEIGAKHENQDVFHMQQLNMEELYVSVLDGHGPAGGDVATHGTKLLSTYISTATMDESAPMVDSLRTVGTSYSRKQALRLACLSSHQSVCQAGTMNTHNSGSTVTIGILRRNQLTMAWLGDSRSVLGRDDRKTGKLRALQLTRDHNCDDMVEAARIRRCGGKVQQYYYCGRFVGPKRIWLKEPGQRTPGLMVSRSIGDEIAHSVGCIADPEMLDIDLTARDKVLIVASDGVWDGLSNQRAVEIAWACESAAEASRAVVGAALEGLRRHGLADNVTAVVVFLPGPGTSRAISIARSQTGD